MILRGEMIGDSSTLEALRRWSAERWPRGKDYRVLRDGQEISLDAEGASTRHKLEEHLQAVQLEHPSRFGDTQHLLALGEMREQLAQIPSHETLS